MENFDLNGYIEGKRKEYREAIEYHSQQISALTGALQALEELENTVKGGEDVERTGEERV